MILLIKENIKKEIAEALAVYNISKEEVVIENIKEFKNGDFACPCFTFAKTLKKAPAQIAEEIKTNINNENYENVEVVGGYINFFLKKEKTAINLLEKILKEKEAYGNLNYGDNKTIVLDYSAPNIAKPFGVAHLRSTAIGNSLNKLLTKIGYKTVSINYIGDFGSQFGKMICAYKLWGVKSIVEKNPIQELKKLYVKFHAEAEKDESLNDQGRKWFKRLEDQEEEALELWQWFRAESIIEFQKTYDLLNINKFDSYNGEAYYSNKVEPVIKELREKNLLVKDDGAEVVKLDGDGPPALIKKSDGTNLYITRDLAAAFDHKKEYDFYKKVYVVGNDQTLHFKQLKEVLKLMGKEWYQDLYHVNFGMILADGKRMATRKGKSVELYEVLNEAIELALEYIEEKNPNLNEKEEISKNVGVGAVIFNDLKTYRTNDVDFNLKNILRFEGNTGPYIQYTNARINSIIKNNEITTVKSISNISNYAWNLIQELIMFEEVIKVSAESYDPSELAKYLLKLASAYNSLYGNEKIISEDKDDKEFKLALSKSVSVVLTEGLRLLGIKAPKEM